MIMVRTPLRVSFFGGGTDHPAWYKTYGPGAVVCTSINKYVYIQLRRMPDVFNFNYRVVWREVEQVDTVFDIKHPVVRSILQHYATDDQYGYEIVYNADLPARAGLGSSSAFTVSCLHAYNANRERNMTPRALAREAIYVEQDLLNEPVGCQDQIAVSYGGLNRIDFLPDGGFDIRPVTLFPGRRRQLESSLLMFFTGFTRDACTIEQAKRQNFDHKQAELTRIFEMVSEGVHILEDESTSIDAFGALLHEAWMLKRSLAKEVSTQSIDMYYDRAMAAGAIGGKLLGAGGGGFMLFYAPPSRHGAIKAALGDLTHVPFAFENTGSRVILYDPDATESDHSMMAEAKFAGAMR